MNSVTGKLRTLKRVAEITKKLLHLNSLASQRKNLETKKASIAKRTDDASLDAPLEKLPTELRLWLLSALRLDELRTLVHASPVFYRDYYQRRKLVLRKSLELTLGSVFIDALAACRTGSVEFARSRDDRRLAKFVKSYYHHRLAPSYSIESERLHEDEISDMISFHLSIVQPLMQYYSNWSLSNLILEAKGDDIRKLYDEISDSESIRMLRTLYRFQLCCNLYGSKYFTSFDQRLKINATIMLKDFLSNFEPWEVEEISCFYTFAAEKFDRTLKDIQWDLHQDNPRFDDQKRPPTPDGAYDLDDSIRRKSLMRNIISQGLELLNSVIFNIKDHACLVTEIENVIEKFSDFQLDEALAKTWQWERRRKYPSERDEKQGRRDPLPFRGDSELDGKLGPPLGWTIIWDGTYSNIFGENTCKAIQRWGYVFWDAARLEVTGAQEVLVRQWREECGQYDPRDGMS